MTAFVITMFCIQLLAGVVAFYEGHLWVALLNMATTIWAAWALGWIG